jgi:hypothetical protein
MLKEVEIAKEGRIYRAVIIVKNEFQNFSFSSSQFFFVKIIFIVGSEALKRVQMRIYRGPSNGDYTQYGYFIRQPALD